MKSAARCLVLVLASFLGRVSAAKLLVSGPTPPQTKGPAAAPSTSGESPITKVVKLLQEMLDKSKENEDKDRELYGKFKCYCDENRETKTNSVASLTKDIAMLENGIAGLKAANGDLSAECSELKTAMDENEAAVKAAENIRQKGNEAFMAEQKDLEAATGALEQAIKVLAEIGADQTMSESASHKKFMAGYGEKSLAEIKANVHKALIMASAFLTTKQSRVVDSFIQATKAPFTGVYSSQSGEVIGILKSMLETFDMNLKSAIAAEKAAEEAHLKLIKIKKDAWEAMSASYATKQAAMGGNDGDLADKKSQLVEAKAQLASDEDFLSKLIPMCAEKAKQFESRKQMRANEAAAISQAMAILQSDVSFDTFQKTKATKSGSTGPTLLQLSRRYDAAAPAERAQVLLRAVAVKRKSKRLASIALLLQKGNPFTVVLEKIDEMIKLIGEEGEADKQNLDWCNKERESVNTDLTSHIEDIQQAESEIEQVNVAVNDPEEGLLVQIKGAETTLTTNHESQKQETKLRANENTNYQASVADLAESEELLGKAIVVLKGYYKHLEKVAEEEDEGVLLQRRREDPAAPETWADEDVGAGGFQGQSGKGKDAISMLEFIQQEVQKEETSAHDAEREAQHSYEDSMGGLKEQEAVLEKAITNLKVDLTKAEMQLQMLKGNHAQSIEAKAETEAYLEKIKPGCDFITKNFETREGNRAAEVKALGEAVDMLKASPGWTSAVAAAEQESWGECKDDCIGQKENAKCKACLAGISVPGYCAGHPGTEGC